MTSLRTLDVELTVTTLDYRQLHIRTALLFLQRYIRVPSLAGYLNLHDQQTGSEDLIRIASRATHQQAGRSLL